MLLGAWANLNEKNGLEDFQGGEENCNYWVREFEGLNICLPQQSWNYFPFNLIMLQTLLLSTWFIMGLPTLYF